MFWGFANHVYIEIVIVNYVQSDRAYNSGWTKDVRDVIDHLNHKYPEAPLFAVGTSIGANILVAILIFIHVFGLL